MLNYSEIFSLASLEAINELYDSVPAEDFPKRISSISDFLKEGYERTLIEKDSRILKLDILPHLELVQKLMNLSSEINKPEFHFGIFIRHQSGFELAINPFLEFCDELSIQEWIDLIDNLEELFSVTSNYLNEKNVWEFKRCQETIILLHEMFSKIMRVVLSQKTDLT